MATRSDEPADARVRAQYEAYPYPARDPKDEARRLILGSPSHLWELNHYVFAGRRDFSRPFRALVAGGGTGDGLVMLAQQLADIGCPAEIAYLDLSEAARGVAESRAEVRGLGNIRFHTLSLLDLADAGLGPFDYIDCCGVLHHLEDPLAGLNALSSVLADDGGLGVMVYGALGRTGVYPAQEMLRLLLGDEDPAARVRLARRLLDRLPPTNWLRRNPHLADHVAGGDAGLYDLLLHSRDRAYLVPEIAELARATGMRITAFIEPVRYDPAAYLPDPALLERLAGLDWLGRCAFAELFAGNLRKHIFYLVKEGNPGPWVAAPDDLLAVPVFKDPAEDGLRSQARPGVALTATFDGVRFRLPLPPLAAAMLARIDGEHSLREIHGDLRAANPGLDEAAFREQFGRLFAALNGLGALYLRYPT